MADWIVEPPSRTPKFWGYVTGTYSHVDIKQQNQTLAETPEANRHQYIPTPAPQSWGKLDDTEQQKNILTNLEAASGAMAYTRSELTPTWRHIAPGTAQVNPRYQLDWLCENKLSAPQANPPIISTSRGACVGEINHTIKSTEAENDIDYAVRMKVSFKAEFTQQQGATVKPSLGGRLYMACQNWKAEAIYDPTVGTDGQWSLYRYTRQSNGQIVDKTYTFAGRSFQKVFSFYPVTTGAVPLFFALQCGKISDPHTIDQGGWEGVDQENKTTFMTSAAGHATGLDAVRDDKWSGQVWIEPQTTIQH